MTTPRSLLDPALLPVWRAVAAYLDRHGLGARGHPRLPRGLPRSARVTLSTLLPRPLTDAVGALDLAGLEAGLGERGLTLAQVLADAGCAPRGTKDAREARLARTRGRDAALRAAARDRLDPAWAEAWVVAVSGDLEDGDVPDAVVAQLVEVLERAADPQTRSRAEVAALALGDAHGLDAGTRARRRVGKALALRAARPLADRDDPELWEAAGLPSDLVSAPVLTWALPLLGDGVAAAVRAATAVGMPAPLTMLTLRDLAVAVPQGTVVLCVENPRLLEAAAQRGLPAPMVCTSGNPRRAPVHLVEALVVAGAQVRHHGDFDPAGLDITDRIRRLGGTPWRMGAADYEAAVDAARSEEVELRKVTGVVPPTSWDPALAAALRRRRLAVDEERVMDDLLADHARGSTDAGR